MDETAGSPDADSSADLPKVVEIIETGDLILDVIFENSKATLKSDRKVTPRLGASHATAASAPKARNRIGFRTDSKTLRQQSGYFEKLLGDTRFSEAKVVTAAFAALSVKQIKPGLAHVNQLPWIRVVDDDAATCLARREEAFADMLRVLHGRVATTEPVTLDYVATVAVLADRFDCAAPASKIMSSGLKLKWPNTTAIQRKPLAVEDPRMSRNTENVLRQKILISWVLNQPTRFWAATRELILNGSRKWTSFPDEDSTAEATWWYLQDGLERESHRKHFHSL